MRRLSRPVIKRRVAFLCLFLFILPIVCLAGWQVTKPESAIPRDPIFQAGVQQKTAFQPSSYAAHVFPNQYAKLGQSAPVYAISISGSLKENLERIMGRYHWRVIWKAPYDYNFDGRIIGSSLPDVINKLMKPFPLQGVMYMSNRMLVVTQK